VTERELLSAFARIAEPVRWNTSRGGAIITFRAPSAAAGGLQFGMHSSAQALHVSVLHRADVAGQRVHKVEELSHVTTIV
jgi:hypothetical protein